MNTARAYTFTLVLKLIHNMLYKSKYLIAHILCYNFDIVGSFKKYYHNNIPKIYYEKLLVNDRHNMLKYHIEKHGSETEAIATNEEIIFVASKYNIQSTHEYELEYSNNICNYYGYSEDEDNILLFINSGLYKKAKYLLKYSDTKSVDLEVFYKLYLSKKFDLIEKYIDRATINMINGRRKIKEFINYISSFMNVNEILIEFFGKLDIEYCKKYEHNIYLDQRTISKNEKLACQYAIEFGIENIDIKSLVKHIKYVDMIDLYEKKIITLNHIAFRYDDESVLFLLKNGMKPTINSAIKYKSEAMKLYIEKYGLDVLSDINLADSAEYVLPIDSIRAINIGWKNGVKNLRFYKYIVGRNFSLILGKKLSYFSACKHYISQIKAAGIQFNEKAIFKYICGNNVDIRAHTLKMFDLKNLLKDENLLHYIFSNYINKNFIQHIIDKKKINLKLLLTYLCRYNRKYIYFVLRKETYCYDCGLHK